MKQSELKAIIKEEVLRYLNEAEFDYAPVIRGDRPTQRSSAYLFTVKNDAAGIEKIKKAKEALKDDYTFRLRGRHHDRKEVLGDKWRKGAQNDVPIKQAEYIAVYVDPR